MQIRQIAKHLIQAGVVLCLSVGVFAGSGPPAFAESKKELQAQIDRLQRDLMDVERLIYRGGTPKQGAQGQPGETNQSNQFADIQVHFNSIEDQLRQLTGQIETANHRIQTLSDRLDKLQKDVEFRLNALEGHGQPAAGGAAAPGQGGQQTPPSGGPSPQTNQKADATPAGALPSGGVEVVYNHALGALRAGDYADAAQGFKGLIDRDPKADLAANAQYWLGETYYVRKMYNDAASAFLKAYQNYPKGPKRPDSLLKLGMSLKALGQKDDACGSFSELLAKFPMASKSIRERARAERKSAGCS